MIKLDGKLYNLFNLIEFSLLNINCKYCFISKLLKKDIIIFLSIIMKIKDNKANNIKEIIKEEEENLNISLEANEET